VSQSFDIRFSRVTGFTALLAAPENAFRWKGGGKLTVDDQGVAVSATSRLPFSRPRRVQIQASRLLQAWREGEVVKLEFHDSPAAVVVLPFWAKDAVAAAEIIRVLPTTRTVEIEEAGHGRPEELRYDPRVTYPMIGAVLVLLLGGALLSLSGNEPAPMPTQADTAEPFVPDPAVLPPLLVESENLAESAPEPPRTPTAPGEPPPPTPLDESVRASLPARTPEEYSTAASMPARSRTPRPAIDETAAIAAPTATASSDEGEVEPFVPSIPRLTADPNDLVVPIRQGTVAYDTARGLLSWFEKAAAEYDETLRVLMADADGGRTRQAETIRRLNSLEARWRNLVSGLLSTVEAKKPELSGFRSTLVAVVSYQLNFLSAYAEGLKTRDQDAIAKAFAERDRANDALERARSYLR
jgi:hypothetical protein